MCPQQLQPPSQLQPPQQLQPGQPPQQLQPGQVQPGQPQSGHTNAVILRDIEIELVALPAPAHMVIEVPIAPTPVGTMEPDIRGPLLQLPQETEEDLCKHKRLQVLLPHASLADMWITLLLQTLDLEQQTLDLHLTHHHTQLHELLLTELVLTQDLHLVLTQDLHHIIIMTRMSIQLGQELMLLLVLFLRMPTCKTSPKLLLRKTSHKPQPPLRKPPILLKSSSSLLWLRQKLQQCHPKDLRPDGGVQHCNPELIANSTLQRGNGQGQTRG